MTSPTDLTALNREIAELRGWTCRPPSEVNRNYMWGPPENAPEAETWERLENAKGEWHEPPPFATEWAFAGVLLEEMGGTPWADCDGTEPTVMVGRSADGDDADDGPWWCERFGKATWAPTPAEAIARAYRAWKKGGNDA